MVKKTKEVSVEDIMKKELSAVDAKDKLEKLEKEKARDKKIIAEYKEREKLSARALVLYERKIKYIKDMLIEGLLKTTKDIDNTKHSFEEVVNRRITSEPIKDDLLFLKDNLSMFSSDLYDICNKLEANAVITNKDRAFIANKKVEEDKPTDSLSRFDRLKQEFNQKIGTSVLRKPGRPKKSEQSIVSELGLRKKVENQVDETGDVENKLNDLFYNAPTTSSVTSSIPKTEDSVFDFNEALNPNLSLKDIMADLMEEKPEQETKTYGEDPKAVELAKAQKQAKIDMLESGFIRNPVIQAKPVTNRTIDPIKKKPTFEKRFLSIQNIVKETK